MFLHAKRECTSDALKGNGRLCLGGQEGVRKENALPRAWTNQTPAAWKAEKRMIRALVAEKGKFIRVGNRLLPLFVASAPELA